MLAMTLETDCVLTVLGLRDRQAVEPEDTAALELLGRSAQKGAVSLWVSYSADEAVASNLVREVDVHGLIHLAMDMTGEQRCRGKD
jgi:hypothetical protein